MLAAFQQYGMQPGPLLFQRSGDLVWTLLASLFIGLVILVMINIPFASVWAKLPSIPKRSSTGITVFSMLGVYAVSSAVLDLWLLIAIGLVGDLMRRYNIPLAPVLIAMILGPMAETELRRPLAVSEGRPGRPRGQPHHRHPLRGPGRCSPLGAIQRLRHRSGRKD